MKGIYLIAIVFLASRTAASVIVVNESAFEAENECPEIDGCPPKLIEIKSDCLHYYECRNQEKIYKTCAAGLHFSKRWSGCVKPEKSECGKNGTIPVGCTRNGDLLPHECQCTKFYECKSNNKVLRICPAKQYFDKDRKICIPGENCKPAGQECENGELLTHECQCNKYYLCKNGQKALRECEKGWNFDPALPKCVKGKCPTNDADPCKHGESKVHDCGCEKYYTCKNKEWILEECKTGQHFSPKNLKCMKESEAGCKEDPSKDPSACPDNVPTKWRHECDCRLYYECENNKKVIKACEWRRYFDYFNQVCDLAEKVSSSCKNNWDNWIPAV